MTLIHQVLNKLISDLPTHIDLVTSTHWKERITNTQKLLVGLCAGGFPINDTLQIIIMGLFECSKRSKKFKPWTT